MRIFTLMMIAGACLLMATPATVADDDIAVRQLKGIQLDPIVSFDVGGQSKATKLADAAAVEKLVGKKAAKAIADMVDFDKETVVLVSWTTSGPPDGKLQHEIKGVGKERKVIFFVQGPGGNIRGQRARIGADLFVVTKNVPVEFEAKERR